MGTDKSLKWSSRPSPEQVRKYQEKWNELDHYVSNEKSLEKLFTEIYPENNNRDEVLIKIGVLNSFLMMRITFQSSGIVIRLQQSIVAIIVQMSIQFMTAMWMKYSMPE